MSREIRPRSSAGTTVPRQVILFLFILILSASPARARAASTAAGDLDSDFGGFGGDGVTSTGRLKVTSIAMQPNGKIVAVGWVPAPGDTLIPATGRFLADGSLDSTFGDNGLAELSFEGEAAAVAVQENGRIVVAGTSDEDFFAARFHTSGVLDASFGSDGVRFIDISGTGDIARDVALQNDGKIVLVGSAEVGDDRDFAVVRLTSEGDLDSTFAGDGKVTTGFGGDYDGADAVAIQPDGKIVVGGFVDNSSVFDFYDQDFALARYTEDGALDTTFDGDGKREIYFSGGGDWDRIRALDVAADGRIVAAGEIGDDGDFAAAVLLPDGALDSSWSDDGRWEMDRDHFDSINAVQWLDNGKILLAGWAGTTYIETESVLMRLDEGGALDTTYNGDGFAQTLIGYEGADIVAQPDGRIVAALISSPYYVNDNPALARFRPDGTLDTSGVATASYSPGGERGVAVAAQGDGKMVVAGEAQSPLAAFARDVTLLRYGQDGQIDMGFGVSGRAVYELPGDDAGRAIVVQPDQKIVVAGFRQNGDDLDVGAWRFGAQGTADLSFGSGGMALVDDFIRERTLTLITDDYAQAMIRQPDGKLVIAGFSAGRGAFAAERWLFALRLDVNGDLDPTFGSGGVTTRAMGEGFTSLRGLTALSNGDLLAVGGRAGDFYAFRLTPDGQPVTSFGDDGYIEYELAGNDEAWGVDSLSTGLIAIVGGSSGNFMLLLIEDDGSMCLGPCHFIGESRLLIDFGGSERAYDVIVQDDNRMLMVGGGDSNDPKSSDFLLARVSAKSFPSPGYGLDTSFGEEGKVVTPYFGRSVARSVALFNDQIMVAGYTDNGENDDVAIARYQNNSTPEPPGPPPPITDEPTVYLPYVNK